MQPTFYGAAAEYNKPSGFQFNPRIFIIVGAILVVIIALMVGTAILSGINAGPSRDLSTLIAKENDIQIIADKNRNNIKSGDLQKANADFSIMVLSNSMVLTTQLSKVYGLSALPKEIVSLNTDVNAVTDLKNALAVGDFDTKYAALLRQKIADMLVTAHKFHDETTNSNLKTLLEDTIKMLSGIDDQIAAAKA